MNRYIQEANQQFISAYNRYPIILDHGEGMYLYDIDGKRYLDFGSGIGVCGLGYHDPNYTRMLQGQIEKLLHTSANSHFLRPAGPHFPASQGHIKRSALEIGRARGAPPC